MAKQGGTNTVTQDAAPWAAAQPALMFGLQELNRAYGQNPYYTGPAPGMTQPQPVQPSRGLGGMLRRTLQTPQIMSVPQGEPFNVPDYGLIDPALAELRATVSGERLDNNPFLEDVIRLAGADVNSQFAGYGRYGSGAHAQELFSSVAAPIRYGNYDAERQRQLAAINQAIMTPYQLYGAEVAAPYEGIRNYLDLVNPIARSGGTQTQNQPIYRNPLAGVIGGGLAGAGLGAATASPAAAAAGGIGAVGGWPFLLGGALLGGLASL